MEQYFDDVVGELTLEDMELLGHLFDQEATASFKAIRNVEAASKCGFSEATFRKVLYRLLANKFIALVMMKRQHSIFITQYGIAAIRKSLQNSNVI